jgi:asparagine synthase (glutamine-hydrolysing)
MDSKNLLALLRTSTRTVIGQQTRVAIAYSGGLDSSIVAKLAGEIADVTFYTCTAEKSSDRATAETKEGLDGEEIKLIVLSSQDIGRYVARVGAEFESVNPVEIAYTMPVMAVIDRADEHLVLVGNGADELFGGYAKYLKAKDPRLEMDRDLRKMMSEYTKLQKYASRNGKDVGFPLATREVISFAEKIPIEEKIGPLGRKLILRDVARLLGLTASEKPKKAAQYSSGIMREMEMLARGEKQTLAEWTRERAEKGRQAINT